MGSPSSSAQKSSHSISLSVTMLQQLAHEIGALVDPDEQIGLPHQVARDAERTIAGMGERRVHARIKDLAALKAHRVLLGDFHHGAAICDLPGVDARMHEVHRLEAVEIVVGLHPGCAHPGDVVVREDDFTAQAARFKRVLEIRPRADPRARDRIGVGADVLHQPLLRQNLRAQHRLRVGVVIAEAHADLRHEQAMRNRRDDRDAIRRLEALGFGHTLAARLDLLNRHGDFDDVRLMDKHSGAPPLRMLRSDQAQRRRSDPTG